MKKILFIMHYPPPIHGAAMVGQYIKESELINTAFDCKYINLSTSKNVAEIGAMGIEKWVRYLKIILQTLQLLWFYRPHLVYITLTAKGVGFYKDALLVFLIKIHGKKVIFHFHNKGISQRQGFVFDNFLYQQVFKNVKVILLAPELYKDVQKYVHKEQVYYCSNGIPEIEEVKIDKHRDDGTVVLLFLSNLIISKGILVLLDACKLLKNRNVDFQCQIVGGPGDLNKEQLLRKIEELGLANMVFYLGKKHGDDKIEVFNHASIFVLPTFYENECFPLVLLEAMQFSLPLVATREGGIPSIIDDGKNGCLVSRQDTVGLAKVLERMIGDKQLRVDFGNQGNLKFKGSYTVKIFERNLKTILHKLIA